MYKSIINSSFDSNVQYYSGFLTKEACLATFAPVAVGCCALVGLRVSFGMTALTLKGAAKASEIMNKEHLSNFLLRSSDQLFSIATSSLKRECSVLGGILLGSCCTTLMQDPHAYTPYKKTVGATPAEPSYLLEEFLNLVSLTVDIILAPTR